MDFVFDKENLMSLLASHDNADFEICMQILKEQGRIYTTFPKPPIQDFTDESDDFTCLLSHWLSTMTDTGANNIKWDEWDKKVGVERPLKSNWIKKLNRDCLQAVFLLNDVRHEMLSRIGGVLYSPVGSEIVTISSLIFDHNQFFKCWSPIRNIQSWDTLKNYTLPCTDIIIVDKYLFADKHLYEKNILNLLEVLSHKNKFELNVVFFTLEKSKYKNGDTWVEETIEFDKIRDRIREILKNITKDASDKSGKLPNVTFVTCSNSKFPEHDREIFTNYAYWFSGDTLCYFNTDNKFISKGRHLIIQSHALSDAKDSSDVLLEDLQAHIDNLKSLNQDYLIGDKVCNFLSF